MNVYMNKQSCEAWRRGDKYIQPSATPRMWARLMASPVGGVPAAGTGGGMVGRSHRTFVAGLEGLGMGSVKRRGRNSPGRRKYRSEDKRYGPGVPRTGTEELRGRHGVASPWSASSPEHGSLSFLLGLSPCHHPPQTPGLSKLPESLALGSFGWQASPGSRLLPPSHRPFLPAFLPSPNSAYVS